MIIDDILSTAKSDCVHSWMEVLSLAKGTADGVDVQRGVIVGVNIHCVASNANLFTLNALQACCVGVVNPQFVGFGFWN